MRPTSTLFQQAAESGLSHQALLRYLLSTALTRAGQPPVPTPFADSLDRTLFAKLPEGRVRSPLHHLLVRLRLTCAMYAVIAGHSVQDSVGASWGG